nr:MAG TPA: hypothetical protein [Crassvirales sp.]
MTTNRQKAAIHFCEQWLNITFNGDIEDRYQVSIFLGEYLQEAKDLYNELRCEYEAYLWDLED